MNKDQIKNMKLSDLETKVVDVIKNKKEVYISEIAKLIYTGVRVNLRPKSLNNSVISAIREINRKYPNFIKGTNRGSQGKLVYF